MFCLPKEKVIYGFITIGEFNSIAAKQNLIET